VRVASDLRPAPELGTEQTLGNFWSCVHFSFPSCGASLHFVQQRWNFCRVGMVIMFAGCAMTPLHEKDLEVGEMDASGARMALMRWET